ncbi:protein-glutamate O-methyltransferase CheR [Stigmatella sp. ncwal1]|uniref:protein-glutamate O-methyltransferase n=1 Tax=Stigmatella ashevillensis TaxID=2995309 RepID=A0ABT5D304_9BACT|nr:protein-glutamate O-methyltransferase CheR [Stigmatella ashevillena]MDC0708057.1 protein-glutamate O-methyltransferase CheR [Stigmatella ashevillena]
MNRNTSAWDRRLEWLPLPAVRTLPDRVFRGYQQLIYREAGIFLGPAKRALLIGRLSHRLRELGALSAEAYLRRVEQDAAERVRLLDAICTHETCFFREPNHFEFLEQDVLPRWRAQGGTDQGTRTVRVWSAGCSTGEEPFSLAMLLRHWLPEREGWRLEILASDLSTRILAQARQAVWPQEKAADIPLEYLKAYMLKGTGAQEGWMKAGPELREQVCFQRVNLHAAFYPVQGRFDLLFCRNVLIYFDEASRHRAVQRLLGHLAPTGYLFLGHAESLIGRAHCVRAVVPTVYSASTPGPGEEARAGSR